MPRPDWEVRMLAMTAVLKHLGKPSPPVSDLLWLLLAVVVAIHVLG